MSATFFLGFGGVTPLHLAVMNGHLSVVTVLVSNGAKLEVRQQTCLLNNINFMHYKSANMTKHQKEFNKRVIKIDSNQKMVFVRFGLFHSATYSFL